MMGKSERLVAVITGRLDGNLLPDLSGPAALVLCVGGGQGTQSQVILLKLLDLPADGYVINGSALDEVLDCLAHVGSQ